MGENAEELLKDGICVASVPCCFNDPFDSTCILKSNDIPLWAETSALINGLYRNAFRVLSLCKNSESLQMWTHYADNGKGICVGIEAEKNNNSFNVQIDMPAKQILSFKNIEYCDLKDREIDLDDPSLELQEINEAMFFRKMKEWSYEEEVRTCIPTGIENDSILKIHLVPGTIKEIILGYRTSSKTIQTILGMVNNPNTASYRARVYKILPTWDLGYMRKIKYPMTQKEKP